MSPFLPLFLLLLHLLAAPTTSDRMIPVNCLNPGATSTSCSTAVSTNTNDPTECCDPLLASQSLGMLSETAVILLRRGYRYTMDDNLFSGTTQFSDVEIRGSGTASEVTLFNEAKMSGYIDSPHYTTFDGGSVNSNTRGISWG